VGWGPTRLGVGAEIDGCVGLGARGFGGGLKANMAWLVGIYNITIDHDGLTSC
jgi:hypothetical protein